jgi:hypothetical protein
MTRAVVAVFGVVVVETLLFAALTNGYFSGDELLADRAWILCGATIAIASAFTEVVEVWCVGVELDARLALFCGWWLVGVIGGGTVDVSSPVLGDWTQGSDRRHTHSQAEGLAQCQGVAVFLPRFR